MTRTISGHAMEAHPVMTREEVLALREVARKVAITPSIQRFALRILQGTHPSAPGAIKQVQRYVREGASPRGGQAILSTARIHALMRGEPVVAEQDVLACVLPSLRHRMLLNFEGEAEGIETSAIIAAIIKATKRV